MSTQRIITVFSTKGKQKAKIESNVTIWGELKGLIKNEGYDISNLHATENVNRTNLEHKDAKLPEGDFTLFLRPKKTKSGIDGVEDLSFKQLRALVTSHEIKVHLNNVSPGKNWTRLSTDLLRQGLASFNDTGSVEEVITEEVETELNPLDKTRLVKKYLSEICEEVEHEDICERVDNIENEVDGLISDLEDVYSPEVAQTKRKEKEENERLIKEAQELMDGF